jgi:GT2 family glycosyltransferase
MAVSSHHQSTPDYPETPDVEILICTHNRAELLRKALHSLNASDRPADCSVGIMVVANACTDDTEILLRHYIAESAAKTGKATPASGPPEQPIPLRWLSDPVPGKSHALNLSLPQTRGQVIAFVDDDHRVDTGYLTAICDAMEKYPTADLFCGRILPDWDGTEPAWVHETEPYRIYPLPVPRFELGPDPIPVRPGTATPGGGNLAIRQGLFSKVGPFRLELGPQGHNLGGAEDIEWVKRAVAGGAPLYYLPDMLQYHYVDSQRMTLGYVMRKAYERSSSTVRLGDQHRGSSGVPPYMLRKAATYFLKALTSLSNSRRRFFMTRLAASLGEIKGARLQSAQPRTADDPRETN